MYEWMYVCLLLSSIVGIRDFKAPVPVVAVAAYITIATGVFIGPM